MTVDIARMNHNAVAVLGASNDALDRLGQWVTAAQQAHSLVAPLIHTAFVPDAYRPKVDPRATPEQRMQAEAIAVANATAAVLQGISLGIDPLTALQQIYIVHGRPGMYTKMMVALVQAHGHEVWDEDLSDGRAVVCGRRKGTDHIVRIIVTMQQARTAGWTSNQAYAKTPQDMLWSRAAARVCDRIASDVLKGIASVEQISDEIHATAEVGDGVRTVTRKRTAAAITATVTEDEPPLDEPVQAVAEAKPAKRARRAAEPTPATEEPVLDDDGPRPITAQQQKMMHALLNQQDMGDRDVALVFISGVVDREITTTKELTVLEAGAVIDTLQARVAEEPDGDQPALDDEWPATTVPADAP